jgi:CheY-like chemotaxis protein
MHSVLVIDDERNVRDAIRRVLERSGFSIRGAESVEDGLAQLRSAPADVVITDIIMPGIDGVTAIELIKRDFPGVKIVAISGGGNFDIAAYQPTAITTTAYLAAAKKAGADGVLTKPFDSKQLVSAIEAALAAAEH